MSAINNIAICNDDITENKDALDMMNYFAVEGFANVCKFLEMYKLMNQTKVIEFIKDRLVRDGSISDYTIVNIKSPKYILNPIKYSILNSFPVKFAEEGNDYLKVYYDIFSNPDFTDIQYRIGDNKRVIPIAVTPFTYYCMSIEEENFYKDFNGLAVLSRYLLDGIKNDATDIHFEATTPNLIPIFRCTFSVGDDTTEYELFEMTEQLNEKIVTDAIMPSNTNNDIIDSHLGPEVAIPNVFEHRKLRFRFVATRAMFGFMVTIRPTTYSVNTRNVEDLGFDEMSVSDIKIAQKRLEGLTVASGKTSSGKNTTLTAMVKDYPLRNKRVIEFSSSSEILMDWPIVEYGRDMDKLRGLTITAKKMHPDAIFINEVPSDDVFPHILDLVNTGHGVYTTMHLARVWEIVEKVYIALGNKYLSMITKLNLVINHIRLSRVCPQCAVTNMVTKDSLEPRLYAVCERYGIYQYATRAEHTNCTWCNNTGKTSTIQPVVETFLLTNEMKRDIMRHRHYMDTTEYIMDYMYESKGAIEFKLAELVNELKLPLEVMYSFI